MRQMSPSPLTYTWKAVAEVMRAFQTNLAGQVWGFSTDLELLVVGNIARYGHARIQ